MRGPWWLPWAFLSTWPLWWVLPVMVAMGMTPPPDPPAYYYVPPGCPAYTHQRIEMLHHGIIWLNPWGFSRAGGECVKLPSLDVWVRSACVGGEVSAWANPGHSTPNQCSRIVDHQGKVTQ